MNGPMQPDFLDVLIDPAEQAIRIGPQQPPSIERAFALLLDARFADYQRNATEANWPSIGAAVEDDASPGSRLLSGIALQLSGAAAAADRLATLANDLDAPAPMRVMAAVFGSIAYRDAARPDLAIDLVTSVSSPSPDHQALLLLHRSVAERELGEPKTALDSSIAAGEILAGSESQSEVRRTLAAIAARNISAFAFSAGRHDLLQRLTPRSGALDRIESRSEEGLGSWLDQEFEGRLQDPAQTTMTFRQEDPVETPLIASLLRAEALADWFLTNDARRKLGRYQLLASIGVAARAPVPGMNLLRRSADSKGLRQALRWYVAQGPLPPVREFGDSVAITPWVSSTLQSDLIAVAETADLMTGPGADVALARILANVDKFLAGVGGSRVDRELIDGVAALLPVTSGGSTAVARKFLGPVRESDDPLFLQSVGRVFAGLDWADVDSSVRDEWRQYAIEHLEGATDHRFTAAALVPTLRGDEELREHALQAFRRQPDLITAVNALRLGAVSKSVGAAIAVLARRQLRGIRDEAAKGSHGFGGFIDAPLLLTHLLMDFPGLPGWTDLVSFLLDPNVATSKKTSPLMEILRRSEAVPAQAQKRIARWTRRPVIFNQLPMDSTEEFKAVILRVRLRYRTKPIEALLAELLEMSTSENRHSRREAALSLRFALETATSTTLMTLALTLSRDSAWDVRGAAANVLALVASVADEPLASMGWQRVIQALRDPGSQVPLWVLSGLMDPGVSPPSAEVQVVIDDLARNHLSHRVRAAAGHVAASFASTRAGSIQAAPIP